MLIASAADETVMVVTRVAGPWGRPISPFLHLLPPASRRRRRRASAKAATGWGKGRNRSGSRPARVARSVVAAAIDGGGRTIQKGGDGRDGTAAAIAACSGLGQPDIAAAAATVTPASDSRLALALSHHPHRCRHVASPPFVSRG